MIAISPLRTNLHFHFLAKYSREILGIHGCIYTGLLGSETVQFGRQYQRSEKTCCLHFLQP